MDGAVGDRRCQGVVHAPVLVDQRHAVELGADDRHLEVVPRPRAVLDLELGRAGEGLGEPRADRLGVHGAMLDAPGYAAGVRLLRALLLVKLGFWTGLLTTAIVTKRALPSRGDAHSDEVALTAIFDGVELESRSTAFRGGSLLAWFGGITLDLRSAKLAPDAKLTIHALWGGAAVRVPPGWRVESKATALVGGVAIDPPRTDDLHAPRLLLDGFALFGGIAVGAKPGA